MFFLQVRIMILDSDTSKAVHRNFDSGRPDNAYPNINRFLALSLSTFQPSSTHWMFVSRYAYVGDSGNGIQRPGQVNVVFFWIMSHLSW
jgi:hypothetical protein